MVPVTLTAGLLRPMLAVILAPPGAASRAFVDTYRSEGELCQNLKPHVRPREQLRWQIRALVTALHEVRVDRRPAHNTHLSFAGRLFGQLRGTQTLLALGVDLNEE